MASQMTALLSSTRLRVGSLLAASIAAALCLARPASAQMILEGRVLDNVSERPLAEARVVLLNRYGRFVDRATTNAKGWFRFQRKDHGLYRIEASAVGYLQATSPPLWMSMDSDSTVVEIRLAAAAVLLAPLEIVALTPSTTSPVLANMEFRRTHGFGTQITREQIEERHPVNVTDILLELPGIYASRGGLGPNSRKLYMARALLGVGGGDCPVQVFIDGMQATRSDPDGDLSIDDMVNPLDVEAIEVFRGLGSIPPEFLTTDARCGVIAIWTRRSLPRRPGS